ncbi:MAG: hypothetical protein MK107_14990 [Oceanicola sp.]|nr:hypothetical protein [Oceanicola sp.]
MADFYAARDRTVTPLPWKNIAPPFTDYDPYVWLLQIGRDANWDDSAIADNTPFKVADPLMIFITLRAVRDLLVLSEAFNQDATQLAEYIPVLEAGAESLWNPKIQAYDSRDVETGEFAGSLSCGSYLCWYAGVHRPEMRAQLQNALAGTKYPVASYDTHGEAFDPHRYWRGPTWPCVNLLIGVGSADLDLPEEAKLRAGIRELVAENGFSECFGPKSGSPAGGKAFSWTAATWLRWARH